MHSEGPPTLARAIAFGFSDLSVAVIPAEAGIQGRVTGLGALDSRFRGNDRREKGDSLAKCDCPALQWGRIRVGARAISTHGQGRFGSRLSQTETWLR
jgi:hypothetical protein